jgi:hypothetical protein
MKKQLIEYRSTIKRRDGVSSYDIDNKRVNMDKAITQGFEYHK